MYGSIGPDHIKVSKGKTCVVVAGYRNNSSHCQIDKFAVCLFSWVETSRWA